MRCSKFLGLSLLAIVAAASLASFARAEGPGVGGGYLTDDGPGAGGGYVTPNGAAG